MAIKTILLKNLGQDNLVQDRLINIAAPQPVVT